MEQITCPANNFCDAIGPRDAPVCGGMAEHTPPEALAEFLCPLALAGTIERRAAWSSARRRQGIVRASKDATELSWLLQEQSMIVGAEDEAARDDSLATAAEYSGKVFGEAYAPFKESFSLMLREVYSRTFWPGPPIRQQIRSVCPSYGRG